MGDQNGYQHGSRSTQDGYQASSPRSAVDPPSDTYGRNGSQDKGDHVHGEQAKSHRDEQQNQYEASGEERRSQYNSSGDVQPHQYDEGNSFASGNRAIEGYSVTGRDKDRNSTPRGAEKIDSVASVPGEENFAGSRPKSGYSVAGRAEEGYSVGTRFSLASGAARVAEVVYNSARETEDGYSAGEEFSAGNAGNGYSVSRGVGDD